MAKPSSGGDTLALKVSNTGFLLDRLGQDCHPLQFLRELTQNAIEAIGRTPEKKGEITWDVDWLLADLGSSSTLKLCITDTGDGMTGEDMQTYINQLSSSGSQQSMTGNYGVGAKIAAATRNHAGLIYLSWKAGKGSMIHLWRDPETGVYGLKQFSRPDGTHGHFTEVEESSKPELVKEHGTKIVLLGMTEDANTMQAPPEAANQSRWIAKYLNTRYFELPEGVTINVREGWEYPRSDPTFRNKLRKVIGQKEYLEQHAAKRGSVKLTGAVAHWWILNDEEALTGHSGYIESAGHIAALHKGELYEMATGRAGRARLQHFGVILGANRVVIYVEPRNGAGTTLSTNTARTALLINNQPLPWTEWETEFREQMPPEIAELMEEIAAKTSESDHSKSIRERLKALMDLYRVSRYRAMQAGSVAIDDDRLTRGGRPRSLERSTSDGARPGDQGGTAGGIYALFQKPAGVPGQEVKPDPFPVVQWVSVEDNSRVAGDIEDRAARFLQDQNLLQINRDFRVYNDLIDRFVKELGQPNTKPTVTTAVRTWFEQALVEAVLGVQALNGAKEWSSADIEKALSEEALTLAVMPRYHVYNSVRRELGSKLGKLSA
jgi:hypothetical protein